MVGVPGGCSNKPNRRKPPSVDKVTCPACNSLPGSVGVNRVVPLKVILKGEGVGGLTRGRGAVNPPLKEVGGGKGTR